MEGPKGAALDLGIQGMSCSACAARIEKSLGKLGGVQEAAVSYASRRAWIRYAPDETDAEAIKERVRRLGFGVSDPGDRSAEYAAMRLLRLRLLVSALLTLPLLWAMAGHYEALSFVPVPAFIRSGWVQLALATAIQFGVGLPFYQNAWSALRAGGANMDVLVALGTSAAYLYSHYVVFAHGAAGSHPDGMLPLYFDTGAVVITAVLLGKYMESRSAARALRESDGYAKLKAEEITVLRADEARRVPAASVRDGDIVLVGPGGLVPVDGIVTGGQSEVDESLLTGESRAVPKRPGSRVWAGTTNRGDTLRIRTETTGEGTLLSRIDALLRQAQASKTGIQRKVDRISARFVPLMLLASAMTYLAWALWLAPGDGSRAALSALAVLLVACPCALGLATPISLVIASGKLARRGIVVKEASALESLAKVEVVLLDKTGTLTEGRPCVAGMQPAPGWSAAAMLKLAAAAEAESPHPYAAAVREEARRRGLVPPPATGRLEWTGYGVAADCAEGRIAVGGRQLAQQERWSGMKRAEGFAAIREAGGETVLFVALGGECIGAISLGDRLKRESPEAVQALRTDGLDVWLATGDAAGPAAAAAKEAGIARWKAGMLPEDKLQLIRALQREGRVVAMAGDGWNDAPALAAADAGFAMAGGTDAALAAGHVALLRSSLTGIHAAVAASRLTMRNIKQNLGFAFLYNIVMVPVAACGLLEPWMAGAAMALSSVTVVGNALRLSGRLARELR
ncbi:heavy metal translocating P-type ATPase [Paenibacillus albicereus]|uniref:P-type Cu(+) transporter n=1 Tax=Paenibacillus albicereus TaxID=2726185 RepID=A0A6H2GYK5_9BACL|nr:heavy metal translocating P-type ATPase [Paenibacillus albicereus]QJC52198.1 heavy metal translocating P-type ATPase [Paenibacillus albicereus]